jgi:hypothetical protein
MADSRSKWHVTDRELAEFRRIVEVGEALVSGRESGVDSGSYLAKLETAAAATGRMCYGYIHRAVDQTAGSQFGADRKQGVSKEAQRVWHGLLAGELDERDAALAKLSFEANDHDNLVRSRRPGPRVPGLEYLALALQLHDLRRRVKSLAHTQSDTHRRLSSFIDGRARGTGQYGAGSRSGAEPAPDPIAVHVWQVLCSRWGYALAGGPPAQIADVNHAERSVVVVYPWVLRRDVADQAALLAANSVNRSFDVGDHPYRVLIQSAGNR